MSKLNRYKITYQTPYVEHKNKKVIYATTEARALTKFRSYIEEHSITVSDLTIDQE